MKGAVASARRWARRAALALLLAATTVVVTDGSAQESPGEIGARVRITILPDHPMPPAASQTLIGRVVASDLDGVEIEVHRQVTPIRIPRGWIAGMWVSEGPESASRAAMNGLVRGGALGAGLGAVVGAEVAAGTDEDFFRAVLVRAAAYGVSIGATTAIARLLRPGERWRRVPVRPAAVPGSTAGMDTRLPI